MIKIALLGSDSTHTEAFANRLKDPRGPFVGKAEVVGLWGENEKQTKEKSEKLALKFCGSIDEALEKANSAMVIGRFGDSHHKPAMQAMKKGLPTFVDKPFTTDFKEAKELVDYSRANKVALCSSSPLRFANEVLAVKKLAAQEELLSVTVSAPAQCIDLQGDARFSSPFFYGIHGIEVLLEIMGPEVSDVKLQKTDGVTNAILEFGARSATLNLIQKVNEFYGVTAFFKEKMVTHNLELDGSYYSGMLNFLMNEFFIKKSTIPLDSTLNAIRILEMIEKQ